jgi:hypothetical protein
MRSIQTETFTAGISKKVKRMEKEFTLGKMVKCTTESGATV